MQECMHMPEPGSVLLAAFPNQCTTGQEGNYKSISPRFWRGQTKWAYIFAQKGEANMFSYPFSKSQNQKRQHSFLTWTVCLPPRSARACLWQAVPEVHKAELRGQVHHWVLFISPHFSCTWGGQEVCELKLPSVQVMCLTLHVLVHTHTVTSPSLRQQQVCPCWQGALLPTCWKMASESSAGPFFHSASRWGKIVSLTRKT